MAITRDRYCYPAKVRHKGPGKKVLVLPAHAHAYGQHGHAWSSQLHGLHGLDGQYYAHGLYAHGLHAHGRGQEKYAHVSANAQRQV